MRVAASCCEFVLFIFLLLHEGTEAFQKTDNEERTLCANLETSARKLKLLHKLAFRTDNDSGRTAK